MIRTRVGYTGGDKKNPTYRAMGKHTEAIEVVYDPERITYDQLLDVFWDSHSPTYEPFSRQYRSAIFAADEQQRASAEASQKKHAAQIGQQLYTSVEKLEVFWSAEDYHQKYSLRSNDAVMAAIASRYPDGGWVDSTVAARLNGILGGHGYTGDLSELGLDEDALGKVSRMLGLP